MDEATQILFDQFATRIERVEDRERNVALMQRTIKTTQRINISQAHTIRLVLVTLALEAAIFVVTEVFLVAAGMN